MPRDLRTSRRAAVGGTFAVMVLSGCTDTSRTDDRDPAPGPPTSPAAEADDALVDRVLTEISTALREVRRQRRSHPSLRRPLRSLQRLHTTHAKELGGPVEPRRPAPRTRNPRQARAQVAATEERLQRRLERESRRAESGALALLLASMAAAVAQERSRL